MKFGSIRETLSDWRFRANQGRGIEGTRLAELTPKTVSVRVGRLGCRFGRGRFLLGSPLRGCNLA